MSITSTYFFQAISNTKDIDQFTDGEIDKDYKPFSINKMVAQYRDLVFFADEMNVSHNISKKDQLIFYNEIIPKKSRRALWTNKSKDHNLEIVMSYYNITQEKADPYLRILSKEQLTELENRLNIGGRE